MRHVVVGLQTFGQDLHFAALRRVRTVEDLQHHACTVVTSMTASKIKFLEKFSSAMQVSCRTAANAWPSDHPKSGCTSMEWFDDSVSSFFELYMVSLVFDLLHEQRATMNWTTCFWFGAAPIHVKELGIQLSSCLWKHTACWDVPDCTCITRWFSANLTERKQSKFSRPEGFLDVL